MAIKRYVRFETKTGPAMGLLKKDLVHRIKGDLFGRHTVSERGVKLTSLTLLEPVAANKVFAVGQNYLSHLGDRPVPSKPEMFYKPRTALVAHGSAIVLPREAEDVHSEGELVLIIGQRLKRADKAAAAKAIWGVTCGNDVSDRNWQKGPGKDVQWWRAKGSDTFGPLGPVAVRGLDHSNLLLTTRINGEVVQQQRTSDLIFDTATIVSFVSQFVTLEPGDLIYTGTPGNTRKMAPGDVVEVEIEGIGTLRNPVRAE
ncbi:MAG TPA: fumarylacetoacetate hydrolase family protein [Bryobacteraceae bacterium]|nr:fumarylacetoacetate hydrolase family protein [Bryobacteraceae bacterium]